QSREEGPNFREDGQYVAELARQLVYDIYKEDTYTRGLNVYTTVSSGEQALATRALREGVLDYDRRRGYRGPEAFVEVPHENESDVERLDAFLDDVLNDHPDSGGLLGAVVLSASPEKVTVARNSSEILTTSGKQLAFVKSALSSRAQPAKRIRRGAVVRIRKTGDNWGILQMPEAQGAFVAVNPEDGAIRAMVGGFDFNYGKFNRVT